MTAPFSDGSATVHSAKADSPQMTSTSLELQPSTPPRGRASSRYPVSLARGEPGRVPLHRRGTSKTYERLEDLLREAGYKETRVFTPEAERREAQEAARKGSMRGGMDTVVGYIASWMPGAGKGASPSTPTARPQAPVRQVHEPMARRSLPASPLAHKRDLHHDGFARAPSPLSISPSASATTIASMRSHISDGTEGHIVPYRNVVHGIQPLPHLRPQSSMSSNLRTYAQVSAAQGYLRHMASAPNMPKYLPSTRDGSVSRMSRIPHDGAHPMPTRWLESVSKAVAGTGHPRAHIGGPQSARHSSRPSSRASRPKRDPKFALGQTRSVSGAPPGLMTYLSPAGKAPGAVSTANVVCRSAPASRSSSRVGERRSGALKGWALAEVTNRAGKKLRRQSKCDGVPVLASTCVENDEWSTHWVDGRRVPLSLSGAQDGLRVDNDFEDDDDDDDDAELDFARLLVPPKRQYSIQSLRRHIHRSQTNLREQRDLWGDDDGYGTQSRSRRESIDDEDGHGWEAMGAPGFGNAKRRRGLPGAWATLSSRS